MYFPTGIWLINPASHNPKNEDLGQLLIAEMELPKTSNAAFYHALTGTCPFLQYTTAFNATLPYLFIINCLVGYKYFR